MSKLSFFGLESTPRSASQLSSLRGTKKVHENLGRTMSLKFKRISEIETARTRYNDFILTE